MQELLDDRPSLGPRSVLTRASTTSRASHHRGAARHAHPPLQGGRQRCNDLANLIVATGHNNLAIGRGILQVAKRFVDGDKIQEGALNRIESVIRVMTRA